TLSAGSANDITFTNAANNFSSVGVSSGKDVSITDSNALIINASTIANSLTLVAGNTLTQTGAIVVPTLIAKTLLNAGASITFNDANNDVSSLNLKSRNAADTANAAGTLTYQDLSGLDLTGVATTGAFNLTTIGDITGSGSVVAGGTTTLAAGSANNITLTN